VEAKRQKGGSELETVVERPCHSRTVVRVDSRGRLENVLDGAERRPESRFSFTPQPKKLSLTTGAREPLVVKAENVLLGTAAVRVVAAGAPTAAPLRAGEACQALSPRQWRLRECGVVQHPVDSVTQRALSVTQRALSVTQRALSVSWMLVVLSRRSKRSRRDTSS
jgi:hypothetical protein